MSSEHHKQPGPLRETDPAEIRQVFLRGGWRALERNYGAKYAMPALMMAGGKALQRERNAIQKCGRPAGGRQSTPVAEGATI